MMKPLSEPPAVARLVMTPTTASYVPVSMATASALLSVSKFSPGASPKSTVWSKARPSALGIRETTAS